MRVFVTVFVVESKHKHCVIVRCGKSRKVQLESKSHLAAVPIVVFVRLSEVSRSARSVGSVFVKNYAVVSLFACVGVNGKRVKHFSRASDCRDVARFRMGRVVCANALFYSLSEESSGSFNRPFAVAVSLCGDNPRILFNLFRALGVGKEFSAIRVGALVILAVAGRRASSFNCVDFGKGMLVRAGSQAGCKRKRENAYQCENEKLFFHKKYSFVFFPAFVQVLIL